MLYYGNNDIVLLAIGFALVKSTAEYPTSLICAIFSDGLPRDSKEYVYTQKQKELPIILKETFTFKHF